MDADFSVELAVDDAVLDFPWTSDDLELRYIDLKSHPESLLNVQEALRYPELAEFLGAVNSNQSPFLTAKCDVWTDTELSEVEDIYEAKMKFCSYIDLLFDERFARYRFDFTRHEEFARVVSARLNNGPQIPVYAEFIIRRCYFHSPSEAQLNDVLAGFYVTFYLFGYGDDEEQARQRWATGLARVQEAILE